MKSEALPTEGIVTYQEPSFLSSCCIWFFHFYRCSFRCCSTRNRHEQAIRLHHHSRCSSLVNSIEKGRRATTSTTTAAAI